MTVAETLPAPAPHELALDPSATLGFLCVRCQHTTEAPIVVAEDGSVGAECDACERCGADFDGAKATLTFAPATPEQLEAHRARNEATGAASERVNARVARGEPAYPPTVLCACCKALPEADVVRRLDYDITLDNCSVCGAFLGVLPCPTPIGQPLASLVDDNGPEAA